MTYNPSIPGPNDIISQSQAQIQTNFAQTDTIFDVNHVTFDNATVADRGKHRFSTYIEQAGDPGTAVNEMAMYTKPLAGVTQLYLQRENGGTVIQMTPRTGGDPSATTQGQSFLPGGVVIQWGNTSVADGSTVAFPNPFPVTCFQVYVSVYNPNSGTVANDFVSVKPGSVGQNGFDVTCSRRISLTSGTVAFAWLAIGR